MNLIIDLGNTFSKIAICDNPDCIGIEIKKYTSLKKNDLQKIKLKHPNIKKSILSSVINHNKELANFLSNNFSNFIELNSNTKLPVENQYKTKHTLGNDRIALVVGANKLFPDTNILVIDTGTAITYDFINTKNQYTGGNISPGLSMRFKALHTYTKKLPLLSKQNKFSLLANDTENAIISGVQNGIVFEIEEYINRLKNQYNDLKVILTGGDVFFFEKKLKSNIFVEPNLVFIGLNRILDFNVKTD